MPRNILDVSVTLDIVDLTAHRRNVHLVKIFLVAREQQKDVNAQDEVFVITMTDSANVSLATLATGVSTRLY